MFLRFGALIYSTQIFLLLSVIYDAWLLFDETFHILILKVVSNCVKCNGHLTLGLNWSILNAKGLTVTVYHIVVTATPHYIGKENSFFWYYGLCGE